MKNLYILFSFCLLLIGFLVAPNITHAGWGFYIDSNHSYYGNNYGYGGYNSYAFGNGYGSYNNYYRQPSYYSYGNSYDYGNGYGYNSYNNYAFNNGYGNYYGGSGYCSYRCY